MTVQTIKKKRKAVRRHSLSSATQLLDEALHVLRSTSLSTMSLYYIGTLPFAAGLLYFTSYMIHGAFALRNCALASLGMVVLFVWMKAWQARFCGSLWTEAAGEIPRPLGAREWATLIGYQFYHPWGLFLLPLSAVTVLFAGVCHGFFQTLTVYSGVQGGEKGVMRAGLACLIRDFPNALVLGLLLQFVGLFVFLNVLILGYAIPFLLRAIFGIETAFSRGNMSIHGNVPTLLLIFLVAHLLFDPVVKAVYTLRCFYLDSVTSGADLLASFRAGLRRTQLLLLVGVSLFLVPPLSAAELAPEQIDESIKQTLEEPEYTWRMPRELLPDIENAGPVEKGFRVIEENVDSALEWTGEVISGTYEAVSEWFRENFTPKPRPPKQSSSGGRWFDWIPTGFGGTMFLILKWIILIAVIGGVIYLAVRLFLLIRLRRVQLASSRKAEKDEVELDLEDEEVTADQLPEDGWRLKADEMVDRGDLRLAMRALYLALLAYLGEQHLIVIAKFKSNRDYARELDRRAHELSALLDAFRANVRMFDAAWYGLHEVQEGTLNLFESNIEVIKQHAET